MYVIIYVFKHINKCMFYTILETNLVGTPENQTKIYKKNNLIRFPFWFHFNYKWLTRVYVVAKATRIGIFYGK